MRGLDETDLEILRLLLEDARRPFSEIAEKLEVSSPTVSDRVDRMRELGLIKGFTVDLNRSLLHGGVSILVELHVKPEAVENVVSSLEANNKVENVFITADSHIFYKAIVPHSEIRSLVLDVSDESLIDYKVNILTETEWFPNISDAELALECVECGNMVSAEGISTYLDGKLYHFCCKSCEDNFKKRYDKLKKGI